MFKLEVDIRVFKMAFCIFFCILFYYLIGQSFRAEAMTVSCLAAIVGIQPDTSGMVDFAKQRIIGTCVGGLLGIIYYLIVEITDVLTLFQITLIPTFSVVAAYLVGGSKKLNAVKGAIATIVLMTLVITPDQGYQFALIRLLATIIGVIISILVNVGFHLIRDKIIKRNKDN